MKKKLKKMKKRLDLYTLLFVRSSIMREKTTNKKGVL